MTPRRRPALNPSRSLKLWGQRVEVPIRTLTGRWVTTMAYQKDSAQGPFAEVFGPGRFSPAGSFPVLYLAEDTEGCRHALKRLVCKDETAFCSRILAAIDVNLPAVLDLCDPATRRTVSLTLGDLKSTPDWSVTQAIGIAARSAELGGILYPVGNRLDGRNLAVILEQVTPAEMTPAKVEWPG